MPQLPQPVRALWLNLTTSHDHELTSPLSVDQCRQRLNDRWASLSQEGVRGFVAGQGVLAFWYRPFRPNPLLFIFKGQLQAREQGCVLLGRMGVQPSVRALYVAWFTGIVLFTVGGTALTAFAASKGNVPPTTPWLTPLFGVLLLAASMTLASVLLRWARRDAARALQALSETIQADRSDAGVDSNN